MAPRRSFLAYVLFAALFYLLPVHVLLRDAYAPLAFTLPTFGLAGLPPVLHLEVSVHYALVMILLYVLTFALVALGLRLVQAYHWERAANWLTAVTSIKDLLGLDRLLKLVAALATLGAVAVLPFLHTEGVAVLFGLAWFSLTANMASQPAKVVPVARPTPGQRLHLSSSAEGDVHKWYSWQYPEPSQAGGGSAPTISTVELGLSSSRYCEYRERPKQQNPKQWNVYVSAPSLEVDVLAAELLALGQERGYYSLEQVCNVLAFVQQCVPCQGERSPEPGEIRTYPRYPIESLMEERGDCQDQAILAASLLQRMGYGVALLVGPQGAAVGVAGAEALPGAYVPDPLTGIHYFYAETTADGWQLGELPEEVNRHLAEGRFEIVPVGTPAG